MRWYQQRTHGANPTMYWYIKLPNTPPIDTRRTRIKAFLATHWKAGPLSLDISPMMRKTEKAWKIRVPVANIVFMTFMDSAVMLLGYRRCSADIS
jgi:hypothetical protein